jgi:hypothetical protein
MTPGMHFSEREKEYILMHCDKVTNAKIAEQLGKLFPEDNKGKRTKKGIQMFLWRRKRRLEQSSK